MNRTLGSETTEHLETLHQENYMDQTNEILSPNSFKMRDTLKMLKNNRGKTQQETTQ